MSVMTSTHTDPLVAWEVQEDQFPEGATPEQRLAFALRYAVLAPSSHNTQPWRFVVEDESVALYADRSRVLPALDPTGREALISCGAALFYLRIALRHFAYSAPEELLPDRRHPELLARIWLGDWHRPTRDENDLFSAMRMRRTYRKPFDRGAIPPDLVRVMQYDAALGRVGLYAVDDARRKRQLAELVAQADRMQYADKAVRSDVAAWMRDNRTTAHDGIPGYALGENEVVSLAEPFMLRTFDTGWMHASHDASLAAHASALVGLATANDTPVDWVGCGEVLARILLRACVAGVYASYLNQPIEVPALRPRVQELLGARELPQVLLRMGYAHEVKAAVKATPRRTVDEVVARSAPPSD